MNAVYDWASAAQVTPKKFQKDLKAIFGDEQEPQTGEYVADKKAYFYQSMYYKGKKGRI